MCSKNVLTIIYSLFVFTTDNEFRAPMNMRVVSSFISQSAECDPKLGDNHSLISTSSKQASKPIHVFEVGLIHDYANQ